MIHSKHLQTRNAMTVCNLSKKFGSFDAVRGLTFGVRDKVEVSFFLWIFNNFCSGVLWPPFFYEFSTFLAQECFGLLGVNGAGKTTTFRMLTGDEIMSR